MMLFASWINVLSNIQVPPYVCSFVVSIACSYLCDKYKQRGMMAVGASLLASVGYAVFLGERLFNFSLQNCSKKCICAN
jgi:Na+/glutamate symporter